MKMLKRIMSVLLAFAILFAMSTMVYAEGVSLIPNGEPNGEALGDAKNYVSTLLGMVEGIGIAVASGMLIYVGIKYVMASANEKADLKNSSIKYVIGSIILFSLAGCFEIVENLVNEVGGQF